MYVQFRAMPCHHSFVSRSPLEVYEVHSRNVGMPSTSTAVSKSRRVTALLRCKVRYVYHPLRISWPPCARPRSPHCITLGLDCSCIHIFQKQFPGSTIGGLAFWDRETEQCNSIKSRFVDIPLAGEMNPKRRFVLFPLLALSLYLGLGSFGCFSAISVVGPWVEEPVTVR